MGSKYTTLSASGYNSSPPSDDGTQAASNLVTWAKHKTKLGDPVKNFADAMNTALVTAFDYSVRQISSSDSTVAGDHMKCVEIAPNVTASVTVSLGDASTMTSVYRVFVKNSSARNQTIGRATVGDTIDGSASNITIPAGAGIVFQTTSGANGYLITAWYGPRLDTDPLVVGSSDGTKKVRVEADGLTTATTRVITMPDRDLTLCDGPTQATPQASTSGTSIDFTGIPSWVKEITVQFVGVSLSGTANPLIQIGDSGGIENSGYLGSGAAVSTGAAASNFTAGFGLNSSDASNVLHGAITLTLENAATFTWVCSGTIGQSNAAQAYLVGGSKSLSDVLDRVRITTSNGTDTFDAGAINVLYR